MNSSALIVDLYVNACMCINAHTHTSIYIYMNGCTYLHPHAHPHICRFSCSYSYTCTYAHPYIHIYIYIFTYMCICMYILTQQICQNTLQLILGSKGTMGRPKDYQDCSQCHCLLQDRAGRAARQVMKQCLDSSVLQRGCFSLALHESCGRCSWDESPGQENCQPKRVYS